MLRLLHVTKRTIQSNRWCTECVVAIANAVPGSLFFLKYLKTAVLKPVEISEGNSIETHGQLTRKQYCSAFGQQTTKRDSKTFDCVMVLVLDLVSYSSF